MFVTGSPLMAENIKTSAVHSRAPALYLIIADKLFKGILSLILACGFYKMAGMNMLGLFDYLVRALHLDPENRFLTDIGNLIDHITPPNMRWAGTGMLLYSLLSLVEGVGLLFRSPWANWLAIGDSAFFIPVEIYELIHRCVLNHSREFLGHREAGLLTVLACNVLILCYLYTNRKRLFHRIG